MNHIVFCTGLSGSTPNTPVYPGMVRGSYIEVSIGAQTNAQDTFKGQILHSSQHKRALDHEGKKVVIVGACTSGHFLFPSHLNRWLNRLFLAHDIAVDYQQHGIGT